MQDRKRVENAIYLHRLKVYVFKIKTQHEWTDVISLSLPEACLKVASRAQFSNFDIFLFFR